MGSRAIVEAWFDAMLADRKAIVPLTEFQARIAKLLLVNRSPDSYLAGGAALHFEPNSIRYSQDLDYFHDSEKRVAEAYKADHEVLDKDGISLSIEMHQPGYIRAIARLADSATKIEWAHDSAWRFMPTYFVEDLGFTLHPVDLAINKVLALAGRDEPRDYLDVVHAHENILSLSGLVWAACGKDPGFTPDSLLELLGRKGKYRDSDFKRLRLRQEIDLVAMKGNWMAALDDARDFVRSVSTEDVGCLFYDRQGDKFVVPEMPRSESISVHFAADGGIQPRIK